MWYRAWALLWLSAHPASALVVERVTSNEAEPPLTETCQ